MIGLLIGIALFCWWLTGSWYAWCVAMLPCFWVSTGFTDHAPDLAVGYAEMAVFLAVCWIVTGLPRLLRRRPPRVVAPWHLLTH